VRFYLDDSALRLCSSCEHLLQCITSYWDLSLPKSGTLLKKVITAAEKSNLAHVSRAVTDGLRGLSTDWEECKKYRNDWVHNERPGIEGLDWEYSFKAFQSWNESGLPPDILKFLGFPAKASGKSAGVGTGRKIDDLHRVVRNAYCQLFGVYERLAPLLN
jgi:hypothetical protein